MGFVQVYKSLQEIFPQIDLRVLRAVAVEHSKDADAAVESVLVEIIPFLSERSRPGTPLTGSTSAGEPSECAVATVQTGDVLHVDVVESPDEPYNMNRGKQPVQHVAYSGLSDPFDMHHGPYEGECSASKPALYEINDNRVRKNADVHYYHDEAVALNTKGLNTLPSEVSGDSKNDETISADKCPGSNNNDPTHALGMLQDEVVRVDQHTNFFRENEDFDPFEMKFGSSTIIKSDLGKFCPDDNISVVEPASLTADDPTTKSSESSAELVVQSDVNHGSDLEELEVCLPTNTASKTESTCNVVGTEDDSTLNTSISQSSQVQNMDALEESITDAKNNKKTLFSAMESVISLMKEVELKEQAAEQAKVEVAVGGSDVLFQLEDLKQMVQRAKDANSMHAGEVYGEKAILATELRELQSRVLSLSDERDKSLSVLDEMRQTLEVRLAAAKNEIESAKQEKKEKEKAAKEAFANQKLIMEKVVEESKILKQQAEDNAMLQEFLTNRGRVVDMLQGEIAVICQDVRLLKDKFDEHVPFSKSLASSQTSCILASSSSSFKSLNHEQVESVRDDDDSLENPKKTESISGFDEESSSEEEEAAMDDDRKALVDDGWELFDNRDIYE